MSIVAWRQWYWDGENLRACGNPNVAWSGGTISATHESEYGWPTTSLARKRTVTWASGDGDDKILDEHGNVIMRGSLMKIEQEMSIPSPEEHIAPMPNCKCGIYALKDSPFPELSPFKLSIEKRQTYEDRKAYLRRVLEAKSARKKADQEERDRAAGKWTPPPPKKDEPKTIRMGPGRLWVGGPYSTSGWIHMGSTVSMSFTASQVNQTLLSQALSTTPQSGKSQWAGRVYSDQSLTAYPGPYTDRNYPVVNGLIEVWGKIVPHEKAWRAQHARIAAVVYRPDEQFDAFHNMSVCREVSEKLGVPLITEKQAKSDWLTKE